MRNLLLAALLGAAMSSANALTFIGPNGMLYGTICRAGALFTAYPVGMAQPVGTLCPIRDAYGFLLTYGRVTAE